MSGSTTSAAATTCGSMASRSAVSTWTSSCSSAEVVDHLPGCGELVADVRAHRHGADGRARRAWAVPATPLESMPPLRTTVEGPRSRVPTASRSASRTAATASSGRRSSRCAGGVQVATPARSSREPSRVTRCPACSRRMPRSSLTGLVTPSTAGPGVAAAIPLRSRTRVDTTDAVLAVCRVERDAARVVGRHEGAAPVEQGQREASLDEAECGSAVTAPQDEQRLGVGRAGQVRQAALDPPVPVVELPGQHHRAAVVLGHGRALRRGQRAGHPALGGEAAGAQLHGRRAGARGGGRSRSRGVADRQDEAVGGRQGHGGAPRGSWSMGSAGGAPWPARGTGRPGPGSDVERLEAPGREVVADRGPR